MLAIFDEPLSVWRFVNIHRRWATATNGVVLSGANAQYFCLRVAAMIE